MRRATTWLLDHPGLAALVAAGLGLTSLSGLTALFLLPGGTP